MKLFQPSPIEFGQIKKIWSDSYHGQKSYFLNNQTIIYACDSVIKLYDTETKESKRFHPFGEGEKANENGISLLTANSAIGKFAFSEIHLSPKVYVYSYEQNAIKEQTKLLDGAVLEYLAIEFSNSEAILTLSGIPDQQIIVWSWKTGKRLVNINLKASLGRPEDLSFCPTNWRRLTVAYKSEFNVWNLDQFDSDRIKSFNQRFVFPVTDDSVDEEQVAPEFKEEFESSQLAITGLNEAYKDNIEDILDKRKRHQFSCLCWLSNDEILVSTQANYIFRYNLSSSTVKCVFKPHQNSLDDERFIIESDHLITKLYLHRQGLFALCIDNNLRVLEGNELVPLKDKHSSSETLVKKIINTSADKIANLSFNTKYTSLAISTNRGIELLDCARLFENEVDKEILNLELDFNNHAISQEDSRLGLAVNFDYGRVVGADTIVGLNNQQFYLVLKEFGTIQVWSLEDSRIVNRLNLNQKSSCLAAHPYMPLVVVGTDEGRIVFIDFSNQLYPRVLEVCNLHRNVIRLLKFNSSGTILFSVGDDKKIFLIDVSLSNRVEPLLSKLDQRLQTVYKKPLGFEPGFYVLGYLEFEGEAVCIDTFDYDESQGEKKIITRVAVGVHDPNNWEITKKNLAESALNMSMSNNPIAPSGDQPASVTHTLVVQNAQTSSTISRMQYSHLSSEPDFIKWDEDASSNRVKLASRVLLFEISYKLISDKAVYNTSKLDLKDELINRSAFHTQYLFSDLVLTARNYLVIFSERFLIKMLIPDMEPAKKILNKLNYLEFSEVIGCHDFGYGRLSKTTNNQIILSGGYDGSIQIRKSIDLTPFNEFRATSFTNGGIEMVKLSEFDKKSIITIGFDNTVFKLEWNCQNDHTTKIARSECLKGDFNPEALKNLKNEENPNPGYETWFEIKEAEFFKQQDNQYLPKKKEILNGLTEIKKRINELMSVNQSRDELSKLKEHEFYLDLEELERLHKEADSEILQIREKTDFENTAKLFVREKIKGECWEDMKVKGRGISAFNSNLLVENYPLKEKSKEEQQLLDRIKIIRTIEMKIQKTRSELTHDIMRRENINELFEADEDDSNEGQQQQQQVSNYTNPNLAQLAYKGSISSLFNGDSPLLYNQFELYAREQKWIQISLIQECIGKIKENFNKEFETVMQRKVQEIARIKEKNLRLKQIYSDLNEEKQLDEPILGDSENPESLFQVKDEEIKVEKYLSPEQKRLLEEQLAEEARRRELERLDNWRERGLMDMMGGVLQIRREDELKKDVPIPSFVKEKPQEEWTLEEQAQYQQYEKKVQELNEERVKLRKQLNVEINKINEQILECYQNFDNALFSLHQRKVKTQQAIFQEELKIVRLVNSLIVDLELETYNSQINERLERSKKEKNELNDEIQQVKKSIEAFKVEYEILSAQDKAQEKAFIREFADVSSAMRDQLLKLFRKRPKQRIVVNKTILSPHPMQIAELGSENNPFADRPSTAQQQLLSEAELNAAMADLDHIDNGPPGVDIGLWSRFVEFRRAKIALENSMRMKAINLNEMMLYLQKRAEDDEAKRREIEELARNALNIQTLRLKASHNLQVQLLLKQGQVEIDPGPYVHNMEHCLLIDRKEVESLNKIIQDHGKQKIAIMIDSKNYRKGIRQFEWEHKKMKMTIEDYIQKQRDITYLKLTREVQEFLNSENYDGKKQQEISTLEQTIAYKKEQYSRIYANQNKKLKGVRDHSVKVANNNLTLDDELKDKNVVLYERKHVENEMTGKTSETLRNERFQQIIQRRKLVDLAKAQAQEVAFLRSEVERLRMKTFPALVQIEF